MNLPERKTVIACAVCLAVGAVAGYAGHRPAEVVRTVEVDRHTVVDESAGLDLRSRVVTVEAPKVVERERIVYREGPVQVVEREREVTGEKSTTSDTERHEDRHTKVDDDLRVRETLKVTEAPRLHAFLEVAAGASVADPLHPSVAVVGGVTYDLLRFGPFSWFVGATVIVPVHPEPLPASIHATTGIGL